MGYIGDPVDVIIEINSVSTEFVMAYSQYDLNKDGVIDLDDLSWALQYLLATDSHSIWDVAKVADFNEDGIIDVEDLVLILANYTIPYYT